MKLWKLVVISLVLFGAACSDRTTNELEQPKETSGAFPTLPTSSHEVVTLSGKMSFWMYEGDAGCYGAITDGINEIQLWVNVEKCGDREYAENEAVSVDVTFNSDNQYGPGKTYTIIAFN
ncbi:hypothetical protein [Saccharophagus degradans]|uniref:Uncharacterized protein n=1 Tax=Saccharophagus degradans (strain 2-40 / ATCC 43961 / DSM 17024) TaxID=203122 RepID=Q21NM4_SACD2|nr:hypothetical protein [Saccharophagus degradans]ABD79705.1 hypothetical protein Sde_0441 [Saccharophagus degradans 2-40]